MTFDDLTAKAEALAAKHGQEPLVEITDDVGNPRLGRIEPCRSCGARIVWCFTSKGNRMPVDAEKTDAGNLQYTGERDKGMAVVRAVGRTTARILRERGEALYVSHFATCRDRDDWRKK